jgi:hypothetical protein
MLKPKLRAGNCFNVKVNGGRRSGDLRTSSSNTLMLAGVIKSFFDYHHMYFRCAVQGDDNFTMLELSDVMRVFGSFEAMNAAFKQWCADLGLQAKCSTTDKITRAELLSMKFYHTKDGYRCGKKPGRVLAKLGWAMYKPGLKKQDWDQLFKGTLISIRPVTNVVPMLGYFVNRCLQELEGVKAVFAEEDAEWRPITVSDYIPVGDETTINHFLEAYPTISRVDIKKFEEDLDKAIKKHGLRCKLNNDIVSRLLACEADV